MDSSNSPSTQPLYRGTQIVWYILGIVEILLLFRVFLKAMNANSAAGFTSFIYDFSSPLASPFLMVFRIIEIQGSTLEWTTLLAMFVYWVIAIDIINLFQMSKTVSTLEAAEKLNKEEV